MTRQLSITKASNLQFCHKGFHSCVPAVTLTFDGGTRRLHWCAEHAADAEQYRDQAAESCSCSNPYCQV